MYWKLYASHRIPTKPIKWRTSRKLEIPALAKRFFRIFFVKSCNSTGRLEKKRTTRTRKNMGRIRKADILASARQQRARILKNEFRHDTVWDSFQKDNVAAEKPRAAAMSAVTRAPCA